jgi:surface protein
MMFAVEVCSLPVTGGATGVAVAAAFLLVLGVIVARWVRASAGRMSIVAVVPLLLLGIGAASTQPSSTSCNSSTVTTTVPQVTTTVPGVTTTVPEVTTTVPEVTTTSTTLAPLNQNLILEIDTSLLPRVVNPPVVDQQVSGESISAMDATGLVFELGLFGDGNVQVDWGDNTSSVTNCDECGYLYRHTYATSGQYTITISGTLTGFGQEIDQNFFENPPVPLLGAEYLTAVTSFGDLGIESLSLAFFGSNNLIDVPAVLPATVTDLSGLFASASSFNDDISAWNTANVTSMALMFADLIGLFSDSTDSTEPSSAFNQSLSSWVTSSVTDMSGMFAGASAFDQSLSSWNVSLVTSMEDMLDDAALSTANYDATLDGWVSRPVQIGVELGARRISATPGSRSRELLTSSKSWIIDDGDAP